MKTAGVIRTLPIVAMATISVSPLLGALACAPARHPPTPALALAPAPAPAPTPALALAPAGAPPTAVDAPFRQKPPEPEGEKPFVVPSVERAQLHGGIHALIAQEPSPFVAVYVVARGGFADVGADHVEVLRQLAATITRASTTQTGRSLEDVYDALYMPRPTSAAWNDAVVLRLVAPVAKLREVTELAADFALHPAFEPKDFDRVRELGANEYERDATSGSWLAPAVLRRALFGAHPYGAVQGSAARLRAVTRAQVVALHARLFDPGRLSVVVTGGIDSKQAVDALEDAFAGAPGRAPARDGIAPSAPQPAGPRVIVVDIPGSAIANIAMGVIGPPAGAPDAESAMIATQVLADGTMGRLSVHLRDEQGLVPGVSLGAYEARAGGVLGWNTRAPTGRVATVLTETARLMHELAAVGPSGDELAWARDHEVNSLASAFETAASGAHEFAWALATGQSAESVGLRPLQYAAVTTESAKEAAGRYLDAGKMRTVVVGDWAALRQPLAALGWGPIEVRAADGSLEK